MHRDLFDLPGDADVNELDRDQKCKLETVAVHSDPAGEQVLGGY